MSLAIPQASLITRDTQNPKTLNYGRQNTLDPTYPNPNALNLILQIPNPASILRPLLGGERTKDLCRQRGYDAVGDFSMLALRYVLQHCDDPSVVNTQCFNSLFALDKLEHLQSTVRQDVRKLASKYF